MRGEQASHLFVPSSSPPSRARIEASFRPWVRRRPRNPPSLPQAGPPGAATAGGPRLQRHGAPPLGRAQRRVHRQGDRRERAGHRRAGQEQPGREQVRTEILGGCDEGVLK